MTPMRRRLTTLLALLGTAAAPPAAQGSAEELPARAAAIIGNTLHYRTTHGAFEMYLFSSADGHYSATIAPKGHAAFHAEGSWQIEHGQICRTQSSPPAPSAPQRICEPYSAYPRLGETGEMLGGKMRVDLIAGRVEAATVKAE